MAQAWTRGHHQRSEKVKNRLQHCSVPKVSDDNLAEEAKRTLACPYTHTHIYIYISLYVYVCMYVCMYVCIYTYTHTHTETHLCIAQTRTSICGRNSIVRSLSVCMWNIPPRHRHDREGGLLPADGSLDRLGRLNVEPTVGLYAMPGCANANADSGMPAPTLALTAGHF